MTGVTFMIRQMFFSWTFKGSIWDLHFFLVHVYILSTQTSPYLCCPYSGTLKEAPRPACRLLCSPTVPHIPVRRSIAPLFRTQSPSTWASLTPTTSMRSHVPFMKADVSQRVWSLSSYWLYKIFQLSFICVCVCIYIYIYIYIYIRKIMWLIVI